ncbi:tripartite tricarboxylate transporter substrate binding protein [Pigmentiphaga sp.]|uniref:Bug family tripartite tricarboxylate transporter substrate binding protein n=1 Tax=Pigmentiphaga sp. TaxID=1977564 RepID=UPI00128CAD2E|nr:tripartite tricarboxylate transporter substrate binding protein [Pigmentiphaga sp.]MPS27056.1 tripartite tricarboxylate transporter substrate binding protein [Alcaligenaceae bacterium SAGV5]MPS51824.1 tripartite tricarboxylate transporter substrate binding protein [Alcaligenaceae bacterium SAGV3]MPT58474.1 tripartite tricarboxylate transporter substrate binding protein [Alcaligenaceae bacterium]
MWIHPACAVGRRPWHRVCAVLAAGLLAAGTALAQPYPSRPVTVINPWTPGGPADAVARPILQKLSERLGQQFVVENRAGANGVIGSAMVARARPDGYTLLFSHVGPITISPALQRDMPYDPVKDLAPITQVVSAPLVLVVRPQLPIHDLGELIAYAKAHPGKLSYGSVGPGSTTHLAGAILGKRAGVDLLHVPYKGAAPVITDMLGGQIDMAFLNISGAVAYLKSGQLRGIAVSTRRRSALQPELPAIVELFPDYEINSWYGLMAPAGTPQAIIDKLQAEIASIVKLPDVVRQLEGLGLAPEGTTPRRYAEQIQADLARWREGVKAAGLTPE